MTRHLRKAAVCPKEGSGLAEELVRPQSTGTGMFCLLDVALIRLEYSDTAAFDQTSVKALPPRGGY